MKGGNPSEFYYNCFPPLCREFLLLSVTTTGSDGNLLKKGTNRDNRFSTLSNTKSKFQLEFGLLLRWFKSKQCGLHFQCLSKYSMHEKKSTYFPLLINDTFVTGVCCDNTSYTLWYIAAPSMCCSMPRHMALHVSCKKMGLVQCKTCDGNPVKMNGLP